MTVTGHTELLTRAMAHADTRPLPAPELTLQLYAPKTFLLDGEGDVVQGRIESLQRAALQVSRVTLPSFSAPLIPRVYDTGTASSSLHAGGGDSRLTRGGPWQMHTCARRASESICWPSLTFRGGLRSCDASRWRRPKRKRSGKRPDSPAPAAEASMSPSHPCHSTASRQRGFGAVGLRPLRAGCD